MQNLFKKPFAEIAFEDIQGLVEKSQEENEILEYKEKYNAQELHKDISAMANTFGGLIIIGIKEKKGTSTAGRIVNVSNSDLENAIDSICYNEINPPIIAFDRKYLNKKGGRTRVFIIKIEESDLTPHAVEYGTEVYIRKKAQKGRIAFSHKADIDRIEWLWNRRKRYVEFRYQLYKRAIQRHEKQFPKLKQQNPWAELALLPKYPKTKFIKDDELLDVAFKCEATTNSKSRPLNLDASFSTNDSIIAKSNNDYHRGHYFELNGFGTFYNLAKYQTKGFQQIGCSCVNLLEVALDLIHNLKWIGSFSIYYNAGIRIELNYKFHLPDNAPLVAYNDRANSWIIDNLILKSTADNIFHYRYEGCITDLLDKSPFFENIIEGIVTAYGGVTVVPKGTVSREIYRLIDYMFE